MQDSENQYSMESIKKLYSLPLPSDRTGALYNAFSYPTKISPESIAIFIACHTKEGATILDPFAGSGTTGLAAKLCDNPTPYMIDTAKSLGLQPEWGKRNAVLYELSVLGSFVSEVMCNPPDPVQFEKHARRLLTEVEKELSGIYMTKDSDGNEGTIRFTIWSEVLVCPSCEMESSFWELAVVQTPLSISPDFVCPRCQHSDAINKIPRAMENTWDEALGKNHLSKKRIPAKIYGQTDKKKWSRPATPEDSRYLNETVASLQQHHVPVFELNWGGLYRKGYHRGITHLHHFYTKRNACVFSALWDKTEDFPLEYRKALQLLLLSYNSTHSTLMTRVVIKQNTTEFVVTGAQSGVLYISNLPVEKNIFEGVRRKLKTIKQAFELVKKSRSTVIVHNISSTAIAQPEASVNYVFTDPPFGDYIPYAELNQLNEAWLGKLTDRHNEAIVDASQRKGIAEYAQLMREVFSQVNKVLKPEAVMSLVFHSAKAEIWRTLIDSFQQAGFHVVTSSILDKIQGSFKQVTSSVKVQGDPLLLLSKSIKPVQKELEPGSLPYTDAVLIDEIIDKAFLHSDDPEEQKPERLFSRYINACLESGKPILLDAGAFYTFIEQRLLTHQCSV